MILPLRLHSWLHVSFTQVANKKVSQLVQRLQGSGNLYFAQAQNHTLLQFIQLVNFRDIILQTGWQCGHSAVHQLFTNYCKYHKSYRTHLPVINLSFTTSHDKLSEYPSPNISSRYSQVAQLFFNRQHTTSRCQHSAGNGYLSETTSAVPHT